MVRDIERLAVTLRVSPCRDRGVVSSFELSPGDSFSSENILPIIPVP